jgi:hypothetical protein
LRTAVAKLKSISPYSQSAFLDPATKLNKESPADFEKRVWRERCHADADGFLFIPPMAFKQALERAANFLSMKIQGRGNATYAKHFKAGVLVTEGIHLPVRKDEVSGETFLMNADGRRGSSKRVQRTYPVIPQWQGEVTFYILDDTITEEVFEQHLREAGNFIGIGRFRPENGGFYGRFAVESVRWQAREAARAA